MPNDLRRWFAAASVALVFHAAAMLLLFGLGRTESTEATVREVVAELQPETAPLRQSRDTPILEHEAQPEPVESVNQLVPLDSSPTYAPPPVSDNRPARPWLDTLPSVSAPTRVSQAGIATGPTGNSTGNGSQTNSGLSDPNTGGTGGGDGKPEGTSAQTPPYHDPASDGRDLEPSPDWLQSRPASHCSVKDSGWTLDNDEAAELSKRILRARRNVLTAGERNLTGRARVRFRLDATGAPSDVEALTDNSRLGSAAERLVLGGAPYPTPRRRLGLSCSFTFVYRVGEDGKVSEVQPLPSGQTEWDVLLEGLRPSEFSSVLGWQSVQLVTDVEWELRAGSSSYDSVELVSWSGPEGWRSRFASHRPSGLPNQTLSDVLAVPIEFEVLR